MKYRLLSGLMTILLALTGCQKEGCSGILRIEYGTSFGECIGYCKRDISVTRNRVDFTKSGWVDSLGTKQCHDDLGRNEFSGLTGEIDLPGFNGLDPVIGCPDCADGGAEWIRVVSPDTDKKVTFEYGKEPDEVKSYIGLLRDFMKRFDDCD
jgi:hypothetical protein